MTERGGEKPGEGVDVVTTVHVVMVKNGGEKKVSKSMWKGFGILRKVRKEGVREASL